ncbi:hypothetical protein QEZ52_12775 [Aliisedimentitalea scapharcae]|uniref:Transposase n=1 Tax=Aliisedimentitalea scapharcae TaxID=1524259 RepID=A0ABZ2XQ34_9RHOB
MPAANFDETAPPRHAQLFELIRQENLSDRISSRLKFKKRRRSPVSQTHRQFLERANQSWGPPRPS